MTFFLWHINIRGLFNAKAILREVQQWCYLTHSWEDKVVHTFPTVIFLKVNVIAQLEIELAYYDSAVQRFNHYTKSTPRTMLRKDSFKKSLIGTRDLAQGFLNRCGLVSCLVGFCGISTFVSYLMPNPYFYTNEQFYFILKGFRTIVFIFIVISTTFRPICPPTFFRC